LETAVKATKKEGAHAQIAVSYTLGDAYTLDYWKDLVKRTSEMGADSICIKDMAGLLLPYAANDLITELKKTVDIPIDIHSHCTSGVAPMSYLKAVEAGCDIIDTAMSPFSMGTSQPATEIMVETFKGTPYDTGFDQKLLAEIAEYFRPFQEHALQTGLLNPKMLGVDIKTLLYQVPGGMLSNLVSQLAEQNASDKYYEVLAEIPKVRHDLGEPPLVTPSSQIVGTQALFNVLSGERYKIITKETKAVLMGEYGLTAKPFDKDVQDKVIGDAIPITHRPADDLKPELAKLEQEMSEWKQQDEDILSYALFPQVAIDFFKFRKAQQDKIDLSAADTENKIYPV
jgi:oxaloacetate decarboxylase alpha subunit